MVPPGILTYTSTPPIVYATWDPANKGPNIDLTGGNLTAQNVAAGVEGCVIATIGKSSGKWFWECHIDIAILGTSTFVGISQVLPTYINFLGFNAVSWGWQGLASGNLYNNNTLVTAGPAGYTLGNYVAFALDMDNGKMWCGITFMGALTWFGFAAGLPATGDPVVGTNPAITGLTGTWYPGFGFKNDKVTANFGATTFHYAGQVPTGYNAGIF